MHRKITIISFLSVFVLIFAIETFAMNMKVVAIVNGEAISSQQLKDRVALLISSSGMDNNRDNQKKVARETIEILINELLQKQEAKEKDVELTDYDLEYAMKDLETKNNIPPNGFKKFIESKGLSYQAALEQIKAGLIWKKTISKYFSNSTVVSDEEIKEESRRHSDKKRRVNIKISEIVIPLEYDNRDASRDFVYSLVDEIRSGKKKFGESAVKHSVGKTGKNEGKVGWVEVDKIIKPLSEAAKKTDVGGISDPVFVDDMYVIIKIHDKRVFDPSNDKNFLKNQVLTRKLELKAKRYIKKLRQKSLIEKKYSNNEELMKIIFG